MTVIGLKELRQNTTQIAERARKGELFTVVKRSQPMFKIVPMDADDNDLQSWLDEYIDQNRELLESLKDK